MSLVDGEPENLAKASRKAQLELSQGFVALNEDGEPTNRIKIT